MAGRNSRLAMLALVMVILVGVLVPPLINVNRYRGRAAEAISRALGRDVTVSSIELKLLPRPGLEISGFLVAENPAYGYEPMLRAETVTAYLRLTSLWRGRFEIGTLDLDNASLNLVRRADGHWNVEELVQHASHVPSAPTARSRPESRPRFPYIEASSARLNFKLGIEKKPFSFTDAEFALWQESENNWGVRLEARPTRTDLNISDMGLLRFEGQFQRASRLRDMPFRGRLSLRASQLGQLSRLVYGRDRGWRGGVEISGSMTGTPAQLTVTFDSTVDDFRRYDIALGESLRLRTHCTGLFSSVTESIQNAQCDSPVGNGILRVRGSAQGWPLASYDLDIAAQAVPMDRLVAFARHAKKDLPEDLTALGDAEAAVTVHKSQDTGAVWAGGGRTRNFALRSGVLQADLSIGEMQFALASSPSPTARAQHGRRHHVRAPQPVQPAGLRVTIEPFAVPLGQTSPATASAYFDPVQYRATITGDAEMHRLVNVARALGIGIPGIGLGGDATINVQLSGEWAGFTPPAVTGKIQLRNVTAELQGVAEPLEIASGTASLSGQTVSLDPFSASFVQGPDVRGSASFPMHCTDPQSCLVHFDLQSTDISLGRLNELVHPSLFRRPWYHLLTFRRPDALLRLHASGRISATHVSVATLPLSNVSSNLQIYSGHWQMTDLRADILGGHHAGSWAADFNTSPPKFAGNGVVSHLSMAQLAALMRDNWATGTIDGHYTLALAGMDASSLRSSAAGSGTFTWNSGNLRHLNLNGNGSPMVFSRFSGKLTLQNGIFAVSDGKLQSPGGNFDVSGSVSYARQIDMKLVRNGGRSYAISGTLGQPKVVSTPGTPAEASLR